MSKIIAIVGPSGVGKTSLVRALCSRGRLAAGLEEHARRPFQALFEQDRRYALANQLDYLIFRAAQEAELRRQAGTAVVDGGLDLDFHGFTRLFRARGWLSEAEYELCSRFYLLARSLLPPPETIVALSASQQTLRSRLAGRERINIASEQDAPLLQSSLEEWLASRPAGQVIRLDVTGEPADYAHSVEVILGCV
ncbi:MAG: AAA family ATPase [Bacteroidota bacterium]